MTNLSNKAKNAIAKYGRDACRLAYEFQQQTGHAANHPAFRTEFGMTTAQASAAIAAGREQVRAAIEAAEAA